MIYPHTFEEKIGMTEIRSLLKAQCVSPLGTSRVDEMKFLNDASRLRELHQQVGELTRIMEEEDGFPDQGFYDMRPSLRRVRIEGTFLEADEMSSFKRSLETIGAIIAYLQRSDDDVPKAAVLEDNSPSSKYPALARLTASAPPFPALVRHIDSILDKFGKVKDTASPELARIRRELAATEGSVSRVLHTILRNAQAEGTVAQDASPTVRDGRLVIPVAPALKRKIRGIVHDESATGKTMFIEPQEVVEANNKIRELEGEERREIIRILAAFASEVRPLVPALLHSYEMLADIEFIRAKSKLATMLNAPTTTCPQIAPHPFIDWRQAIHPLLQRTLQKHGKQAVPSDFLLTRHQRILLISGPNAGGKSICLKTVGLLQYMLQCGLSPTLGEGSQTGVFDHIMIDIGDEQSIEDELSTYSSHLLNMKQMMRQANPSTLLLIDEFGGGTEPQIGGAMAEAMLRRFVQRGAFGIITTHYQNLKLFAEATDGVVNGAMLYDRHLMQALFVLQVGNPGSSFAVEIARKTGIPEDIISDATDIVGRDYVNADKWLQDIVRDKRYWEQKRQAIHRQELQMQQTVAHYESKLEELNQQRKDILQKAREEAAELLSEANSRIERTIREIRESQAGKEQTREARRLLEEFRAGQAYTEDDIPADDSAIDRKMQQILRRQQRRSAKEQKAASPFPSGTSAPAPLQEGSTVRIKGQNSVGTIQNIRSGRATVLFGQMLTTVDIRRLQPATPPRQATTTATTFLTRQTQDQMREKSLNFRQDIDVRGMRGDEALQAVRLFIDDAMQVGADRVRILHGTGSGILRQLIRQYLHTVPSVAQARDEHVQFGGAGITVVDMK